MPRQQRVEDAEVDSWADASSPSLSRHRDG